MYYDDFDRIDYDALRKALEDYYGTAIHEGNSPAVMDLGRIADAPEDELIDMAFEAGIDPDDFEM